MSAPEPIPLSSAKAEHYAKLRARLDVQKASEHEAIAAIDELCHDNERLALRTKASVAAALEAAAAKSDRMSAHWRKLRDEAKATKHPKEARDFDSMALAASFVSDAIRALITKRDHDALQAAIDAEVAKVRAEDAADSFAMLIADARAEAEKAMTKFPQPNYVISKFAEEAGEVVKAAIHCAENRETADNVRGEMKQAIAMLYRLWVEGDQVHGLKPLAQIGAKP